MKIKFNFLILVFSTFCSAQINIPDLAFKNALTNTLCVDADLNGTYESDADLNNDGQIQSTEATIIQRLKISNNGISNLSGIETFTSLKIFLCDNNLLPTLSLATFFGALSNLQYLDCSHNQLTSLNLYPNSTNLNNLTVVNCSYNQINSLNLSHTSLINLNLSNNNLSSIIQNSANYNNLTNLNISNNLFTSYTVDYPNLSSFVYNNNPMTSLTFNQYSNNPITVSNIGTLQSLIFNSQISVPIINLSVLPNLSYLKVYYATIQNDVVLANLPSLNSIDFQSPTKNLTLLDNLGFTQINSGFSGANTLNLVANNFHISGTSSITNINISSFSVVNFSINNMPNLTSLKIPSADVLQSVSLSSLPLLQNLEIGVLNSTISPNCIDLTIQNFTNLNTIIIQNYNLGQLILNSLPSLTNFTNTATSCNSTTSSFTLANLPLLYDAKILDKNLSNLNVNNLNSIHDLEIYSTKLASLNLTTLPQLYTLIYTVKTTSASVSLPMLTIANLPNLNSIYLSRLNNGGLNLTNLPNLYSLIVTNDYPSIQYIPQNINYSIANLPNLNYVQLDEILTTNLTFLNVPNLTIFKMRSSNIGASYSFQNISVESIFIDNMATVNNLTFNNLPNFHNLNITNCSKIQSLNLGNTNTSLQSFILTTTIAIPSTSITSLNFTNFTQLTSVTASYSLTSLVLSSLPNLSFLNLSRNKLNTISLTNFPQLNELICNYNQPTINSSTYQFPLTLSLPQLTKLNVNYNNNKLANLDLSNCPLLNELHYLLYNYTSNGNIPYINMKNGNSNFSVFESNTINNICVDDNSEKILLQSLNSNLSSTIFTTYCSFNPGGLFYTMQGNSILDINNNGCDLNDINFPNINLQIISGSITSSYFANNSGSYSIPLLAGQYTVSPIFENPNYYIFSPSSVNVNFPSQSSPLIQNFCITPNGNHSDLEVTLLPITPARPGFDAVYKIIYKNKGNQTQSGNITLSFDDSVMDFITSNQTISGQTTNLLNWTFSNLNPFENRSITLTFNINSVSETPPVVSGAILNYSAQITGLTDENPNDNTSNVNQIVVNAFDPNDKTCIEGQTVTTAIVGNYVHYMIRFQNTGTANAQNIVVKDNIDLSKFDLTTLVPISGSSSFYTRITNTNQVEFIFENINLPFSSGTNNGYVSFKIKTNPTLIVGDNFSNKVNIYFDYNNPIVTNNFVSTIQNSLGQNSFESNTFSIYPNPIKDVLFFKTNEKIYKVEVFDISGRILSSKSVIENYIDLRELKIGDYILKIYTEKEIMTAKIIKQ